MKALVLALALSLATPVFAAEPSEASIQELLQLTNASRLMEASAAQVDAALQSSMQAVLKDQAITPEVQALLDEMRQKAVALVRRELRWEVFEPQLIDIYRRSFTQEEMDGMLDFYRSPAGRAVVAKLPLVMQSSMHAMQQVMERLTPELAKLQQETAASIVATEKAQKAGTAEGTGKADKKARPRSASPSA